MPGDRRPFLGPALFAWASLLLGCGEPPTRPLAPSAPGTADASEAATDPAAEGADSAAAQLAATDVALGPEALRSRLEDPLLRELLAGLDDRALQASIQVALQPLAEAREEKPEAAHRFQEALTASRQIVGEALAEGALGADDALALAVLELVLAGPGTAQR